MVMKNDRHKMTNLDLTSILDGTRPDTDVGQVMFQRAGDNDYAFLFNSEERTGWLLGDKFWKR